MSFSTLINASLTPLYTVSQSLFTVQSLPIDLSKVTVPDRVNSNTEDYIYDENLDTMLNASLKEKDLIFI